MQLVGVPGGEVPTSVMQLPLAEQMRPAAQLPVVQGGVTQRPPPLAWSQIWPPVHCAFEVHSASQPL